MSIADNKKQREANEDGEGGEETIKWGKTRRKERGHALQAGGKVGEKGEEEGSNNGLLLYSDEFPSRRGVGGLAEARPR